MFAYAFNNPVMYSDPTGNWPKLSTVFKAVTVAALVVAAVAVCVVAVPVVAGVAVAGSVVAAATTVGTVALVVAGVSTAAAVTATVAESTVKRKQASNHTVYKLVDDDGKAQYVGRTTNVVEREKAHRRNPDREHLKLEIIAPNLNRAEARGLEQIAMLECHTINTANKMNNQINGISPFNKMLGIYMEAGRGVAGYLENQISNEILYWTGK